MPPIQGLDNASENVGSHVINYLDSIRQAKLHEMDNFGDDGTVSQVIKLWIKLSLLLTRRRPEIAVASVVNHILPYIGNDRLSGLNRLTLNRMFNALLAEGKISAAKRTFALSKQFLSWAENQGYMASSPLSSMKRRDVGGNNKPPRQRVLSDAEIWVFWHGLDQWALSEQCRWTLRLCLVSARRPDEVLKAKREEFMLEQGIWHQGTRNKSQRDHTLPISPLMALCIQRLDAANHWGSPWLAPSPKDPSSPLSRGAIAQALRRMIRDKSQFSLPAFTPRDLRRTARTRLAALGISNDVARKIMNHALEGIDRIYDRHDYLPQMMQALTALSEEISRIIHHDSYREVKHHYDGVPLSMPTTSLLHTIV